MWLPQWRTFLFFLFFLKRKELIPQNVPTSDRSSVHSAGVLKCGSVNTRGDPCNESPIISPTLYTEGSVRNRTPSARWCQDGMIACLKALVVWPNGVPSVSVVSAFLHNLRVNTGGIYEVSQMLMTRRLELHRHQGQWKWVVLRGGTDLQDVT